MAPRHSSTQGNSILSLVIIFAVLGVFSLAAGYLGGQYLLSGITGEADVPTDGQEGDQQVGDEVHEWTGITLDIYRVQVGAFSDLHNAEKMAEQLRNEGHPAAVIETTDDVHRVIVEVASEREPAQKTAEQLESGKIEEAIAVSWPLNLGRIDFAVPEESREDVTEFLELVEDLIHAQAETTHPVTAADDEYNLRDKASRLQKLWGDLDELVEFTAADFHLFVNQLVLPNAAALEEGADPQRIRETYLKILDAFEEDSAG